MENNKLLKNMGNINTKTVMICFPFAGGGASAYMNWTNKLDKSISLCPVQLPGREKRFAEPAFTSMKDAVDALMVSITAIAREKEIVLYGHSMGARIAYEVAKELQQKGINIKYLFVSGSPTPDVPEAMPIYHLNDNEFIEGLKRFDGTPKEILENQELISVFLPMLRADFTLIDTYCEDEITVLHCPIMSFGGDSDNDAKPDEIREWSKCTNNSFDYKVYSGGHFFIKEHEDDIMSIINHALNI